MKYKINNRIIYVSLLDYFRARRISKDIKIAMKMIDEYNLKDKLKIDFNYSCSPLLYVGMKYNQNKKHDTTIDFPAPFNIGYYSFGGYGFRFNKKKFYNKVIKPYTKKEYK